MTLVFDAQALIGYLEDEPGASALEPYLDRVASGDEEGWASVVNLAEVAYVMRRRSPDHAEALLEWILGLGIREASADTTWADAARFKADHRMSLADAFALATAREKAATLVTRNDGDFDVASRVGVRLLRV